MKAWLIPEVEGCEHARDLCPVACISHCYTPLLRMILERARPYLSYRKWLFGIRGGPGAQELAFVVNEGFRRKREWGVPFFFVLN